MSSLKSLPPITADLKQILPFLQRAQEVLSQDQVIAYWAAYYAAQLGISLKARDVQSRDFLLALLGALERLKLEIGPTDAIDMEAASAAYVENFALKVFQAADSEDRAGRATRSTAKRFLAAANFLEVLKTFPKSELSDSNDEKVRYAKWKAADIAKAFREGRKPTPGPAGSGADHDPYSPSLPTTSPPQSSLPNSASQEVSRSPPKRDSVSPPRTKRASPITPTMEPSDIARANANVRPGQGNATPGSWSTTATPGTTDAYGSRTPSPKMSSTNLDWGNGSPTRPKTTRRDSREEAARKHKPRSGSGSSSGSGGVPVNLTGVVLKNRKASVSEELEGKTTPSPTSGSPPRRNRSPTLGVDIGHADPSNKKVHFTPSVVGGMSTTDSPPTSPNQQTYTGPSSIYANMPVHPPPTMYSPTSSTNTHAPPSYQTPPKMNVSPISYPLHGPTPHLPPSASPTFPPSGPQHSVPPSRSQIPPPPPPMVPAPPVSAPFELTPSIIAKAQKHCRFAISALDYEDAEHARKELRAALAALGG